MDSIKTVLVLAPHPDDGEFAAGASLAKFVEEGKEVWYVALSPCLKSIPEGFEQDVLYKELGNALSKIGIDQSRILTNTFPVREFPAHRQEILEYFVGLRKKIKPDLVLMPNGNDVHQDHHVVYEEGVRAFKHSKMLGYELPWNNLKFVSNFHIKVDDKHLDLKVEALKEYKSQQQRVYSSSEFIKGLAMVRGVQVNSHYAEAFELIRWMI